MDVTDTRRTGKASTGSDDDESDVALMDNSVSISMVTDNTYGTIDEQEDAKKSAFFGAIQQRADGRYGAEGWGYEPEGVLLSKLNVGFFKSLWHLSQLALTSWREWMLFLTLPVTVAAYIWVGYYVMLAPGYIYTALINDDLDDFIYRCTVLLGWVSLISVIKVFRQFITSWISNEWRNSITTTIHELYMTDLRYYTIQINAAGVDNPDQRIVTDIKGVTTEFSKILGGSAGSGGLYEGFGNILWYSVQTAQRAGWYGLVMAYGWSALMAVFSVLLINVVAPWVFRQERFEALFRFLHVTVRTRAEDIAFLGTGGHERNSVKKTLDHCVDNTKKIITRQVYLNSVEFAFGYLTTLIMYVSLGIAVFSGLAWNFTPESERAQWIAQTSGSFISLLFGFTILIQMSTQTSDFVAFVMRVSELHKALLAEKEKRSNGHQSSAGGSRDEALLNTSSFSVSDAQELQTDKLQITSPAGDVLVTSLSFVLKQGDSLLVMGASGGGKTSLLRVLRGLWPASNGSFSRPPALTDGKGGVFFLPQRPYLAYELTLKQQMMYPNVNVECNDSDDVFIDVLGEVGLTGIVRRVGGLNVIADWQVMLSVGEQQRLCLARVLWHNPAIAILDESTASLDVEWEKSVYAALKRRGVGVLSVGHRESLIPLHNKVLRLKE
ncbi:hypothetical protein SARC_01009 [Sphaeroforma arctica JP610]|uniref:ABC transporter domain-containing protein n=1 Tax=Sphaeroforma arctica JP610 TaxID=667725 RepID=A0A0L0GEY3_9EUKA|nr:hypothetical protein SARC_01009 [Sphaeroforma arctica JP610]KNC86863.1 hypothetical protein SARC_01009 [Sphaeroforma arctica JP610]|eukprot:XP_014160765.1 hypothetical protein SARC_01009 [Sphaeroforma arctica JP610]